MFEEYYNLCKQHNDCTVLYQVGSFFEVYEWEHLEMGVEWYDGPCGTAKSVSKTLNHQLTKKNSKLEHAYTNPYMVGFPVYRVEEHVKTLIEHGYKIVIYRQESTEKGVVRYMDDYMSPGLYSNGENVLMTIYYTSQIGICILNATTGEVQIGETPSLSELQMYINIYEPNEFVLFTDREFPLRLHPCESFPISKFTVEQKNARFQSVWNIETQFASPIEVLHLEFYECAQNCLVHTVEYIRGRSPLILRDSQPPKLLSQRTTCKLHHNIISYLDIKLLFKQLNFTKTIPGKQLLYHQLTNPCIRAEDIEKYYTDMETIKENQENLQENLSKLVNLEILIKRFLSEKTSFSEIKAQHEQLLLAEKIASCFSHTTCASTLCSHFFQDGHVHTSFETYHKLHSAKEKLVSQLNKYCECWDCKLSDTYMLYDTPTRSKKVSTKEVKIVPTGSKTKVEYTNETIQTIQHKLLKHKESMEQEEEQIKIQFTKEVKKSKLQLIALCNVVSYLDTLVSRNIYTRRTKTQKAVLTSEQHSYVTGKNMYHPILNHTMEVPYQGNDVSLKEGMLLYGLNGAGKSCYIKTIALHVIMAQAGFTIPGDAMELTPFHDIFMRVDCHDDMMKHQSSFQVEMKEMDHISEIANQHSLVLGDEILKSTDYHSANMLASAFVMLLQQKKCKFIIATHLHELHGYVENVPVFHIKASIDKQSGTVEYNRTLSPGPCKETNYGLHIGQFLIHNKSYSKLLQQAKKACSQKKHEKSKYNAKLLLIECEVCKSRTNLHTHHIQPQAEFPQLRTQLSNLVCLCESCHVKVHQHKITIEGWKRTKQGKVLIVS